MACAVVEAGVFKLIIDVRNISSDSVIMTLLFIIINYGPSRREANLMLVRFSMLPQFWFDPAVLAISADRHLWVDLNSSSWLGRSEVIQLSWLCLFDDVNVRRLAGGSHYYFSSTITQQLE